MDLIHINRKVFNALGAEERELYVKDIINREVEEYNAMAKDISINLDDIKTITKSIIKK
jgi:hypothetical protein